MYVSVVLVLNNNKSLLRRRTKEVIKDIYFISNTLHAKLTVCTGKLSYTYSKILIQDSRLDP